MPCALPRGRKLVAMKPPSSSHRTELRPIGSGATAQPIQVNVGVGGVAEAALEDAVRNHEWSGEAQSRFLFFVLDAPPHYRPDIVERLGELTREASEKGIRIIGVSSSGVDKETEFLMRNLGIHTGGTYVFLTDHSGIGESHIEPTIGSYAVEYLDDLIVRLIVQYTERPESVDAVAVRKPRLE